MQTTSPSLQLLQQLERYSLLSVYPAPAKLAPWVQCIWYTEPSTVVIASQKPPSAYQYPDGGATLQFEYNHQGLVKTSLGLALERKAVTFQSVFGRMGVHFKPGGLFALCGIEAAECYPATLDNLTLTPRLQLPPALLDTSHTATTMPQRIALLWHWLEERAAMIQASGLIQYFNAQSPARAEHFLYDWPISERQIERHFMREVGVCARTLMQMQRIHYARALISFSPTLKLTDIAQKAGYYDQSHFIKAFRKYVQTTPSQYRKRKRLLLQNS